MTSQLQPGDVLMMPLSDGGYGACQVTAAASDTVAAYALDCYSTRPPTLDDLVGVGPLRLHHHSFAGRPAHQCMLASEPLPPGFRRLGILPVPTELAELPGVLSGWDSLADDVVRQRRWDRDIPAAAREAWRSAASRGPVDVDFGAGPVTVGGALGQVDLTPAGRFRVPESGPVRWSALDDLPRCTTLLWSGPDRGLTAALAERPLVGTVVWRDAPATVDLTGTGVQHLTVTGSDLHHLRVPRVLWHLELVAPSPQLTVRAADAGRWLRLRMVEPDGTLPVGLDQLRELCVDAPGTLSAAPLAVLTDLEALSLCWRRGPGELTDAAALAHLTRLSVLRLVDAYGLAGDTLPDLPALRHLGVHGLRRSTATALRARYRRSPVCLDLHGAKADTWLTANVDNPFRDWVDDHTRAGQRAARAYATAARALNRLGTAPTSPAETTDPARLDPAWLGAAEAALRALVDTLNQIEERHEIIDTLRREQAGEAFLDLATRVGVPVDRAEEWFDDWRDF